MTSRESRALVRLLVRMMERATKAAERQAKAFETLAAEVVKERRR